ncbi:MAG: hypothetical protein ACTSX9_08160 [Candidatus Njordarchaeales archaeon]
MSEKNEISLESVIDVIIDTLGDVAQKNYEFLRQRVPDVLKEVSDLFQDVFNIQTKMIEFLADNSKLIEYMCVPPATFFVLSPQSDVVLISLLLGHIPMACYSIRMMLEASMCAFLVDMKYGLQKNVFEKAQTNEYLYFSPCRCKDSIAKVLNDNKQAENICNFWKILSSFWVHPIAKLPLVQDEIPTGLLTNVILDIVKKGSPPSYAISFPMYYDEEDLDYLKDVAEYIAELRKVLKIVFDLWFTYLEKISKNNQ